jgi:hypothetical protein
VSAALQGKELLDQYKTRLWMSDGKIIYLTDGMTKSARPKERHSLGDMVIHAVADVPKTDREEIKRFLAALHEQAARAIGDTDPATCRSQLTSRTPSHGFRPDTKSVPSMSLHGWPVITAITGTTCTSRPGLFALKPNRMSAATPRIQNGCSRSSSTRTQTRGKGLISAKSNPR